MVLHLQFADDTLIFMKEGTHCINNLQKLIQCFELVSGLRVNWDKSSMIGIGLNLESVTLASNQLDCDIGSWLMQYLGVPIGGNMRFKAFWNSVIERCQ